MTNPQAKLATPEQYLVAVSVVVPVTERYDPLDEIYRIHADILKGLVSTFEFIFVLDEGFETAAQSLEDTRRHKAREIQGWVESGK